jgi:hypothetical protein
MKKDTAMKELQRRREYLVSIKEELAGIRVEIDQLEYALEGLRARLAERQGLAQQVQMDLAELQAAAHS